MSESQTPPSSGHSVVARLILADLKVATGRTNGNTFTDAEWQDINDAAERLVDSLHDAEDEANHGN